jgi:hypothetical protein
VRCSLSLLLRQGTKPNLFLRRMGFSFHEIFIRVTLTLSLIQYTMLIDVLYQEQREVNWLGAENHGSDVSHLPC